MKRKSVALKYLRSKISEINGTKILEQGLRRDCPSK